MTFLGIDVGSLSVRAVLIDEGETVLAESALAIETDHPEPGAAEQDPDRWWAAALVAIEDLRGVNPEGFANLRGIGLTGQMHATVLLDEAGVPVRPAMTWRDCRAIAECVLLEGQCPEVEAIAGAAVTPTFTAPRLLWLRDNEPEQSERIAQVLSAKDYVRFQLTGEYATDTSDAAATLLFDQTRRNWSGTILAASGIARALLPTLLSGPAWSGMVRRELLAEWGINHEVVVAAGAGDIAAAAVGLGAVRPGDAMVSLDGAAQLAVTCDTPTHDAATPINTFAHTLPDRWFETSTLINGTLCLERLMVHFGETDVGKLVGRAQEAFSGPSPLLFLPHRAGQRGTPSDPDAPGTFAGLDGAHGERAMTQSVLEGIALALREAEEGFGARFPSGAIPLAGEGSRSPLFMLIVASVLDRPILRLSNADIAAAFGAARLGRMAATGASAESVAIQPPVLEIVDPLPHLAAAYAEQRSEFRSVAQLLRQVSEPRAAKQDRRRRASR
jgi:xylulokinase